MADSHVKQMAHALFMTGMSERDALLTAVATLAMISEGRLAQESARTIFCRFSAKLTPQSTHDGLAAAKDWLEDPSFTTAQWNAVESVLNRFRAVEPGPIDWSGELEAVFADQKLGQFGFGLSFPVARAMRRVLDFPPSHSIACLFLGSTTLAWQLSADREVSLFVGNNDFSAAIALIARAACRTLKVDRRNPLDGSYMPETYIDEREQARSPVKGFDHVISVPPMGLRVHDGPKKGAPVEIYQLERLASSANKSFASIVPQGALFRENRQEVAFRERLTNDFSVSVMSLPSGVFQPYSSVATGLLLIEPAHTQNGIRVVDARTMEGTTSTRVSDAVIARHLEEFQSLNPKDQKRVALVGEDALREANFSFLPDRYLLSGSLAEVESALAEAQSICLEDVARIERPKAPMAIKELPEDPPIQAFEITPSDITDGVVHQPRRRVAFNADQADAVEKITVGHGDILVSTKGNVGIIGMVPMQADASSLLGTPWIISQSLAIIRLEDRDLFGRPEVLNAVLTAPWVREKLESMSGGSAVRTLPISALRSLQLPLPTMDEIESAQVELNDIEEFDNQITNLTENRDAVRSALWHALWRLPQSVGDE